MLTEGEMMDETVFNDLAEAELMRIEVALENCGAELDIESKPGGVLDVEFDNGSKIIINRHTAAKEIWVAARSGGYHFRPEEGGWIAGRDGAELYSTLSRLVEEQSGTAVTLGPS
jgi:CyaY protein